MWHLGVFQGLSSENSLFLPAMFEMVRHKPTKSLFLQHLQLVPAKFLGNKAFRICEHRFALRFSVIFSVRSCHIDPKQINHIYIYIYMAKASFSAYVLLKKRLRTAEKVHFLAQKSATNFGLPFCSFPFPLFRLKMVKMFCFCLSKSQKSRQKTRPPPYIYIYIYIYIFFFFFFFGAGGGWGERIFYWKSQERGVSPGGWGRWARGREGLREIWGGGGAKYFFFGAEIPTKQLARLN